MEERQFYRHLQTSDVYVAELVDGGFAVINDGARRSIVPAHDFQDTYYNASEELEVRPFQHQITIGSPGATEKQVVDVFNSLTTQALALTRRQHTPFEVLDEDDRNSHKTHLSEFKNAVGFWHSAMPYIDHNEDENGELYPVVRLSLDGFIFAQRFLAYFDIDDETIENQTDLSSLIDIVPRFLYIGDDETTQVFRTEFDVIVNSDAELSDENDSADEGEEDGEFVEDEEMQEDRADDHDVENPDDPEHPDNNQPA